FYELAGNWLESCRCFVLAEWLLVSSILEVVLWYYAYPSRPTVRWPCAVMGGISRTFPDCFRALAVDIARRIKIDTAMSCFRYAEEVLCSGASRKSCTSYRIGGKPPIGWRRCSTGNSCFLTAILSTFSSRLGHSRSGFIKPTT